MFDSSPVINILIILTIFTICASIVRNPNCALALLFSLVTARLFTEGGDPHLHFNIMIFFAAICVFDVSNGSFKQLSMADHEINYAVGYLYIIRMIAGLLCAHEIIGKEFTLIVSSSMLVMQNMLVLWGVSDGSSRTANDSITHFRNSAGALVLPSTRV
tara:strand:- start:264 stop:740 length:477 start_codon:yes stop_codon:yes gene_type:complete